MTNMNTDTDMPSVNLTQDPLHKPEGEHPFWQDLNPDSGEGENSGLKGPHPEQEAQNSAANRKDVQAALQGFNDEELNNISIMPTGSRLEQGATYIDLQASHRQEFSATGDMVAGENNWYVPKSATPYWIWNRLIGVGTPERLDREEKGS